MCLGGLRGLWIELITGAKNFRCNATCGPMHKILMRIISTTKDGYVVTAFSAYPEEHRQQQPGRVAKNSVCKGDLLVSQIFLSNGFLLQSRMLLKVVVTLESFQGKAFEAPRISNYHSQQRMIPPTVHYRWENEAGNAMDDKNIRGTIANTVTT